MLMIDVLLIGTQFRQKRPTIDAKETWYRRKRDAYQEIRMATSVSQMKAV